jgi:hypothetical protein
LPYEELPYGFSGCHCHKRGVLSFTSKIQALQFNLSDYNDTVFQRNTDLKIKAILREHWISILEIDIES